MEHLYVLLTLWTVLLSRAQGYLKYCDSYPKEVDRCFSEAHKHPVNLKEAHVACIRKFYEDNDPDLNITKSDRAFFDLRAKYGYGLAPPPTGFRIRKEYRRLTKDERIRLHSAFNVLYKKGVMARFGRLHATATDRIHRGASFLAWHRLFITDLEEELRRVDPKVALAYWDYTIDNNITRPSDSVVWSPCFFGNGNGTITEGPYRGWYGGRNGRIQRDFARDACDGGRLVNKFDVLNVLTKCHLEEISSPPDEGYCNLETLHDGVHQWVGGDMNDLLLSAFDPIFYFHHAFVDHVWELFRRRQAFKCNVDPETDYPPDNRAGPKGHRAFDRMTGYEYLRNVDALTNNLPIMYYNYEPFPTCPDCGHSEYLYCDFKQQICLTRERDACDMQQNEMGVHTYTGRGDDGIGFTGAMVSTFTPFVIKHGVRPLRGDGRHRDMSRKEARKILIEESKTSFAEALRAPFSPMLPMMPSTLSSSSQLGGGQQSPTVLSDGWPHALNSGLEGFHMNDRHQFSGGVSGLPVNHGFVPFRYPENQSGQVLHFNAFRQRDGPNRKLPFSPGFPPLPRFPEFDMHPPMRNFYNFSPQVFPTNFKKSGKGYYY